MPEAPRFLDCGEAALSVEFGDRVDPETNARVLALDEALRAAPIVGLRETTPTYRSLLAQYEPMEISRDELIRKIRSLMAQGVVLSAPAQAGRGLDSAIAKTRWILPCCYDPSLAEDIAEAAAGLNLSAESLARLHIGGDYRAYMYGFAPGWLYLGGLPPELATPRRLSPRGPTPQGAVLIGGGLSLIATNPMPTGWYVIGRTPERLFAPERAAPFFIAPGDAIAFEPIDASTFQALNALAALGEIVSRREALA